MAGEVIVGEHRVDKAGTRFDPQVAIRVRGRRAHRFVSRGGLKLEHAIQFFEVDVLERIGVAAGKDLAAFASVNQMIRSIVRPAMWRMAYEEACGTPVTMGDAMPPALWRACLAKDIRGGGK